MLNQTIRLIIDMSLASSLVACGGGSSGGADCAAASTGGMQTANVPLVVKFVRVAARYQADGTLVATRVWASSQFNSVWVAPEGHVLDGLRARQ
jgi:hypothetical protein